MSKRYYCESYEKYPYQYEKSQKKVKWQDEAMEVCLEQDSCVQIEDDIFGGRFDALSIDKKTNKQTLYEKELNKYKKDKNTIDNLFYLFTTILPASCVNIINDYSTLPYVSRQDYITRCDDTYLQLDKCDCYYCKDDRKQKADDLQYEHDLRMEEYNSKYCDF